MNQAERVVDPFQGRECGPLPVVRSSQMALAICGVNRPTSKSLVV